MPQGEKNKLKPEDRVNIFGLKGTKSAYDIADNYGVSHTAIYKIWNSPSKYQNMIHGPTGGSGPGIDTEILKKLIPEFVKAGIEVNFTPEEIKRIQKLAEEIL